MSLHHSCVTFTWLATIALLPLKASALTAACGANTDPVTVVNAQVDAYNAHDVDAFAACYANTIHIQDLSGQHQQPDLQGLDELHKRYNFLTRMPKDFHVQVVQQMVNGNLVVNLERLLGRPNGKPPMDLIAIFDVRDGKIASVWFPPQI